jgi:hypothetical protein
LSPSFSGSVSFGDSLSRPLEVATPSFNFSII